MSNKLTTAITSVGHFFAKTVSEVVSIGGWLKSHQTEIDTDIQLATGAAAFVVPGSGPIDELVSRVGQALVGQALGVINDAGAAAALNGLNLPSDEAILNDLKQILATVESVKPGTSATATALKATLSAPTPPATTSSAASSTSAEVVQTV